MKKIIVLIFIILFYSANAQTENDIPIFHRLLILNSQNELMVVKIENVDFWVTPGLYQTKEHTIKEGIDSIASTYGIKINELKLKGTFILKRFEWEALNIIAKYLYSKSQRWSSTKTKWD